MEGGRNSHHMTSIPPLQARVELRRLKYLVCATWAAGVIHKWFLGWQARKMAREMRFLQQAERAVVVIQAYFRGWRVSGGQDRKGES